MAVKRLGRGLAALIPDTPPEEELQSAQQLQLQDVEVSKVRPNPFQPRETFDPVALDELKQSIAENGIVQPISVRITDTGYELIAGERRLRSVRELGIDRIPAYILDVKTDEEMIELSLIENIQRENLNPIDEANGFQTLIGKCNLTQDEVAKKVGKDRSTITNSLRMLKLPNPIQESLIKGEISSGHARAFLGFENKSDQISAWKKTVQNQYSVRQVENLVRGQNKKAGPKKTGTIETNPYVLESEDKLRTILGTQVRIKQSKKGGRGSIEVEFYSDDDLERILELFEKI